jgi:hypothetical protein
MRSNPGDIVDEQSGLSRLPQVNMGVRSRHQPCGDCGAQIHAFPGRYSRSKRLPNPDSAALTPHSSYEKRVIYLGQPDVVVAV